jgi:alpha-tubulin suppressor-like RCC1 family protein
MARGQGGTLSGFTPLSTPNAPTGLSVSTSIGSATVSFEPPADTGDAPITAFVVTAIDESTGVSVGATGSASPITVSPPAGGTFKIRAQAVNGFGPGRLTEFSTGNAVFSGAELYAWGSGDNGRLGDGTVVSKSSPIQIGALTTWSQVSAGDAHTAAVKTDGTLWTWGDNGFGRLGLSISQLVDRSSPVQVGALTNWAQITAGDNSSAAIKTDGTLWAWGFNTQGSVGDNTIISRSSPVQVGALTEWRQLSVGQGVIAVKTAGTLWSWGGNNFAGQIGDGTTINRSSPVQIGALSNWYQVSSGSSHRAAIKADGTLWAWGLNSNGQVGDGTVVNKSSPVQVGVLTSWSYIDAGGTHNLAVKTDGTLWAWGDNGYGRLGDNTTAKKSSPIQVGALTNWAQITAGDDSSSAVKTDGTLWAWGRNNVGQIGDNTTVSRSSPVQIGASTGWLSASVGGTNHTTAILGVI